MPSSRGVPPTPLNIRASSETNTTHGRQGSFDSSFSDKDSKVGSIASRTQLLGSNRPQETSRTSRFDEYRKSFGHHNQNSQKSSKPHSPTVNVYTHCGRHTDQYLLGGWSEAFKNAFKKN
ncbi:uncharacterized protein GGS22DRAFT_32585 [Annulohypoxylon maeteangense]|uniref:uncharacterized protein n=1 Tax=Annulohypoxylon maeteangense TaxID=1927788 RepID=UPI002007E4F0|nr:uncharacterized protein GGS22DRAFT_32585 [Annulohypoxylon maeteangense]KAI0883537.1 hypothetical protein GGS22DRAFT_32585 [Annulohypoxylon maeteangense]